MTSRLAFSLLLLGTLVTLAPRVARADDPLAQAKAHFEAGRSAYLAGDYAKAIGEFQAAQAIKPSPILDYNIGLSFEGLGDAPRAIESYRHYLALKPDADNRADVEQRIRALQAQQPPPPSQGDPNQPMVGTQGPPPSDPNAPQGYSYQGYQGQPGSSDPYTGAYAPPAGSQPSNQPPPPRKKSRWWIPVVVVGSVVVTLGIIVAVAAVAAQNTPVNYAAPPQALDGTSQSPALLRF